MDSFYLRENVMLKLMLTIIHGCSKKEKIKMKKLFIVMLMCFTFMSLTGCSLGKKSDDYKGYSSDKFIRVEDYADCTILVDKETNIAYILYSKSSYFNGLTPLLDEDGNAVVYKDK